MEKKLIDVNINCKDCQNRNNNICTISGKKLNQMKISVSDCPILNKKQKGKNIEQNSNINKWWNG